ncbi:hypothetical protein LTR94_025127 [Friedmanniomyces endolithicus]|nr:hypothetical protein LTR94_025127 [Friedmanniomyces endolithicus]
MRLSLIPHPLSPPRGLTLDVEIRRSAKGVSLEYDLAGAVETVLLPPFADRVHTDGLWKATCFEMFIAGAPGYFEYNFSPSGAWAAYGFDGYRSSMRRLDPVAPFIVTRSAFGRFSLTVDVEHPAAAAGPIGLFPSPRILRPGPPMNFGLDRLLSDDSLRAELKGRRVALLAHPASVAKDLTHAIDALAACSEISLSAAFGPQHGMKGDLQDNMMESPDYRDPVHDVPVFSLYGEVRRPKDEWMETFDVLLIDLQDLGCRIYTFITTLLYVLEAAEQHGKSVWVLDRPNAIGRPVEGFTLRPGFESFVGAGPMPMRHGMTMGELGLWFIDHYKLNVDYRVIEMQGWLPEQAPGHGWPTAERSWVNPSPNAPNLSMARAYPGTVMVEGATLSEGRGTTRPLELFGAPDIDARAVIKTMRELAPHWLDGCILRDMWFEPTFHKHVGTLCSGVQIHSDTPGYDHARFKPWRLQALGFKAIRTLYPDYPLWRDFPYEYAFGKLPIDVINGGAELRLWVDDAQASPADLDAVAGPDEAAWLELRRPYLLY